MNWSKYLSCQMMNSWTFIIILRWIAHVPVYKLYTWFGDSCCLGQEDFPLMTSSRTSLREEVSVDCDLSHGCRVYLIEIKTTSWSRLIKHQQRNLSKFYVPFAVLVLISPAQSASLTISFGLYFVTTIFLWYHIFKKKKIVKIQ